jgi:hypothetical protein
MNWVNSLIIDKYNESIKLQGHEYRINKNSKVITTKQIQTNPKFFSEKNF